MDDDGVDVGRRVPIKARVEVAGDEMTIDLATVPSYGSTGTIFR
ncbi:MAG TPA: hypothetical protein VKD45_00820 [Hyphomicrobiaceae bacterium]|nr:hypothetical protein [Hyphomicrobiaceae bacterium]